MFTRGAYPPQCITVRTAREMDWFTPAQLPLSYVHSQISHGTCWHASALCSGVAVLCAALTASCAAKAKRVPRLLPAAGAAAGMATR